MNEYLFWETRCPEFGLRMPPKATNFAYMLPTALAFGFQCIQALIIIRRCTSPIVRVQFPLIYSFRVCYKLDSDLLLLQVLTFVSCLFQCLQYRQRLSYTRIWYTVPRRSAVIHPPHA